MPRRFNVIHACVSTEERARAGISRLLGEAGRQVVHVESGLLGEQLDSIDVLLCGEPPRIDWSRARRLRLLQLMSSGIEGLWPATGLHAEVEVASARGIHLPEMRDHALALMLAFERRLLLAVQQQRERRWSPLAAGSLSGKTVALVGLGEVGRAVAAACAGFGMRVVGVRAEVRSTPHVDRVYAPQELDDALRAADYVVVVVPLTDRTRGLLDARALSAMQSHAVLIHLSRGGIVDETALCAALLQGRLAGAALDVFEREPLPPDSPLWTTPNLLITPHAAGRVRGYVERALKVFVENLERIERGDLPTTRVDRTRGY